MNRLCVFCGSRTGSDGIFASAARDLGVELARRGIELVYGGGNVGLMGVIADAVLEAGGHVTGVIPAAVVGLALLLSPGAPATRVSPERESALPK